ncbi:MAG TPA: hypothetical protein VMU39_17550 [Solirubrobacteraceae bacterium]|nr:hypothetical protein [Solirubrobacteraceae bacterium]
MQGARSDERARQPDRLFTSLDTDHRARGADALGQRVETPLRAAPELNDAGPSQRSKLIEHPGRVFGELVSLSLEPLLLGTAVTE